MTSEAAKTSIIERIKETTVETDVPVTLDADLYEDLRIWGGDFYELIAWIAETFGTDEGRVQLSLSVFFFGLSVGQLIYGPLVDRFGQTVTGMAEVTITGTVRSFDAPSEAFIVSQHSSG